MNIKIKCLLLLMLFSLNAFPQEMAIVTTLKANLRGTPATSGVVVTTLDKDESVRIYAVEAPWYLVQSPKYVGWVHGNGIKLIDGEDELAKFLRTQPVEKAKPKTTTKPLSTGESPFQKEYVGGEMSLIRAVNDTDRVLTLKFGGIVHSVAAGGDLEIKTDGGRYEYFASVPRAVPTSGVKEFGGGYRWTGRFYIVRN